MKNAVLILSASVFLVVGCATKKVWFKEGADTQDFNMDQGQCHAQAFSVPFAPPMQVAIVYNSCMRGKGWELVPAKEEE